MMAEAETAARLWGATVTRALSERENAVYQIALPGGARAALRLHRQGYQGPLAIRSELWWCAELAAAGLPVPRPVPLPDGVLMAELPSGRCVSVVEWIEGRALGAACVPLAEGRDEQVRRHQELGQLLARVHQASDRMELPVWFTRHRWDAEGLVGDTPTWGRFWDHPGPGPDDRSALVDARDWLRDRLAGYQTQGADLGLIHADALRENVMVDDDSLTLIDFDDAGFGFRLYDLGSALSQNLYEPAYRDIRAAMIEGYASIRAVDEAMVDAFTLARTLASVGWTMPRVAPDAPVVQSHIARAVACARMVIA